LGSCWVWSVLLLYIEASLPSIDLELESHENGRRERGEAAQGREGEEVGHA